MFDVLVDGCEVVIEFTGTSVARHGTYQSLYIYMPFFLPDKQRARGQQSKITSSDKAQIDFSQGFCPSGSGDRIWAGTAACLRVNGAIPR
jgi:hypothetical protein